MKWTMPSAISGGAHGQVHIPSNEECGIRDVWKHNLEEEFRTIRKIVQKYHFVAMDTEFPGVVARPVGEFRSTADYHYQLLRCNVDLLRIIQLGLTFMDDEGKTPPGYSTWQFNFKFNLSEDMYAQDSIDLLQNSGIQFKKHEEDGIDPIEFAELLMSSGIVLMDNIKWLCFHSGYDFGYLLKLLTDQNLPADESEFFELLHLYFPNIFDIKYLMKSCKNLKGGLQEVADQLELRRVGPQHQAGSDALLTGMAFFKMREVQHKYDIHIYIEEKIILFAYVFEFGMFHKAVVAVCIRNTIGFLSVSSRSPHDVTYNNNITRGSSSSSSNFSTATTNSDDTTDHFYSRSQSIGVAIRVYACPVETRTTTQSLPKIEIAKKAQ